MLHNEPPPSFMILYNSTGSPLLAGMLRYSIFWVCEMTGLVFSFPMNLGNRFTERFRPSLWFSRQSAQIKLEKQLNSIYFLILTTRSSNVS